MAKKSKSVELSVYVGKSTTARDWLLGEFAGAGISATAANVDTTQMPELRTQIIAGLTMGYMVDEGNEWVVRVILPSKEAAQRIRAIVKRGLADVYPNAETVIVG